MLKNMFALIGVVTTWKFAEEVAKGFVEKRNEENAKAETLMKNSPALGPIWDELNAETRATLRDIAKKHLKENPEADAVTIGYNIYL